MEQELIGWEHWLKGQWSGEWSTFSNFDVKNINLGIQKNGWRK
jgi:hypothetical protein